MPSANFATGRDGNDVSLIVDHWMAGSFDAALARFRNPTQEVSAHFLVGTDGRIAQVVPTDDTAFHAGNLAVNFRSIGIEHEAGPNLAPSDELYAASAWLHREMARIYHLTLKVGVTVKPHRAIVPTQCPGTLDLYRIVANEEPDDLVFANDPDAQAFKNDINNSIEAIKEDLRALHAAIAALGNAQVPMTAVTLAEIAATAQPPAGYHWVGTKLVAN